MKKYFFFLFLIFCSNLTSFAQLQNGDFENWTHYTTNGVYDDPDGWNTNNNGNGITVVKSTDSYSGNFAMQMKAESQTFNGQGIGGAYQMFYNVHVYDTL